MLYLVWRGDRAASRATVSLAFARVSPGRLALALLAPGGISASPLTADSLFAAPVAAIGPASFEGDTARFHLLRRQTETLPDDPVLLARYGLALARAGRGDEAVRAGRRAADLLPMDRDASGGAAVRVHLARIHALAGAPGLALELLAPLAAVPSWISAAELGSDPAWASLRGHPRFAELVPAVTR
jgi:hypothetical protein